MIKRTYSFEKMARETPKHVAEMLNDIADVVNKDMRTGIEQRRDIDNSPTKPLKAETIKAKARKGSDRPDLPRVDTGKMSGVLGQGGPYVKQRATAKRLAAVILPALKRASYSIYQQATRPWFGISKRTEPAVDKILKGTGLKIVRSAHVS